MTDGSENGSVFVLPASIFILFQICRKSGNLFDSWLCSSADVIASVKGKTRREKPACTPVLAVHGGSMLSNSSFGQAL